MAEEWREIADRVFLRRHRSVKLNVGLVVGDASCLVVDTRASHRQGLELAAAVVEITALPRVVVNTHPHWDHFFGNAALRPAEIWSHTQTAAEIRDSGQAQVAQVRRWMLDDGDDDLAGELDQTRIDPPDRTFDDQATIDLGGRSVQLRYLGRGHTDGDAVVWVPDSGVVFAGDLVEEGDPPSFEDSFPLDWPATLTALAELATGPVVPGHGHVVDRDFVAGQGAALDRLARTAVRASAAGHDVERAWADLDFGEYTARTALARAYRQLDGEGGPAG